jgi:hypothetical protein
MAKQTVIGTTIPANESLSGEIDLGTHQLVAIVIPSAFNGTTIAFQAKAHRTEDRTSASEQATEEWKNVLDDTGTELTVTVAANSIVGLKADKASVLSSLRFIRIRSGTNAAPVGQNPTRELLVIAKEA